MDIDRPFAAGWKTGANKNPAHADKCSSVQGSDNVLLEQVVLTDAAGLDGLGHLLGRLGQRNAERLDHIRAAAAAR